MARAAAQGRAGLHSLHSIMSSEYTQSSLQLGVGMLVASLFTYVLPISFPPMSCVTATWLCVVAVMASPANHLGVRINSAVSVLGSTWLGALLGAAVVSLSHASGPLFSPGRTALLGVMVPAVLAVLATIRVARSPPLLWAQGMNACLACGLTALTTYPQPHLDRVWYIAATLILANAVSAAVVVLVAALILPTHATQEVQSTVADVLLLSGAATSRYAGRLFRPPPPTITASTMPSNTTITPLQHSPAAAAAADSDAFTAVSADAPAGTPAAPGAAAAAAGTAGRDADGSSEAAATVAALTAADSLIEQLSVLDVDALPASGLDAAVDVEAGFQGSGLEGLDPVPLVMQESDTREQFLQRILRNSTLKQAAPDASTHAQPQPPVAALRPRLAKAQTLFLSAAAVEPQWLRGGWGTFVGRPGCYWFHAPAWAQAMSSMQLLLTRLSALEAVIEDGESLHTNENPGFSPDLLNHISLVYSKVASSLAHMSQAVRHHGSNSSTLHTGSKPVRVPAKPQTAAEPATKTQQQLNEQQTGKVAAAAAAAGDGGGDGGDGSAAAAAASAAAVDRVCGRVPGGKHCWQQVKVQLTALMQEECESHWLDVMRAAADSPVILPSLTGVRHMMFTWSLTTAIIDTVIDLEAAVTAAVTAAQPQHQHTCASGLCLLLGRVFGWVPPCLPMLSGRNQVVHCSKAVCVELPAQLRQGWQGVRKMVASPLFQAGFKYWLVLVLIFEVTLIILYSVPAVQPLNPGFGFVAASLSMSERVEATVSKFVFWAVGTILGGALGFLAMWHPALALNPYGLVAVIVGAALVVGLLGVTKARVGITLVLMTLSTLILCQCCAHVGHWEITVARVASVLSGITLSVLICNLLMPWYTSAWSIDTMRSAFLTAVQLFDQMQAQFYADGAARVTAFESQSHRTWAQQTQSLDSTLAAGVAAGDDAQAAGAVSKHGATVVAAAAAEVAAAAGKAAAAVTRLGHDTECPVAVTPAVLQSLIARPLVAVQTSLLMDTVAWQHGVLATPPVVPALLRAMFGLLDRLAGLQLALQPPSITQTFTGAAMVHYAVPMAGQVSTLLRLAAVLASAVAAVLTEPSRQHCTAMHDALSALNTHRAQMYLHMQQLRQQLHIDVHMQHRRLQQLLLEQHDLKQQGVGTTLADQICPVKQQMEVMLGGVDDVVRYMGFQFATIKVLNAMAAVANVAAQDSCRTRNSKTSTLK